MRELVEAERTATALVKTLRTDLASEKQQHEQQVKPEQLRSPSKAAHMHTEQMVSCLEGMLPWHHFSGGALQQAGGSGGMP